MATTFNEAGFQIFQKVLSVGECDALIQAITVIIESHIIKTNGKSAGLRNLLQNCPPVAEIASSAKLIALLRSCVSQAVFPVRALFFDKTETANWHVSWHQDLTIAVADRIETTGFGPWSVKAGVTHVQPPREILERMLAIRLHLDDCNENNGTLKIIPGSHCHGKLSATEIMEWKKNCSVVVCEVAKGDALIMRPLILHASSPAVTPRHRRVIHIEYAIEDLPVGLRWFERKL